MTPKFTSSSPSDATGLDKNSEVEVSADGQTLVATPKRSAARERKFRESVDKMNQKYAGVFERLSK